MADGRASGEELEINFVVRTLKFKRTPADKLIDARDGRGNRNLRPDARRCVRAGAPVAWTGPLVCDAAGGLNPITSSSRAFSTRIESGPMPQPHAETRSQPVETH